MIHHIKCDLFDCQADVIVHQVNCMGVMGSGVAAQVKARFPEVYARYKTVCRNIRPERLLGMAQYVKVSTGDPNVRPFAVVNLFAQKNYGKDRQYTDYAALRECLHELKSIFSHRHPPSVAIPYKMGCVRGGGDWGEVLKLIENELANYEVFICEKDMG